MTRPKTKEYVTYSFKCLKGRDDELISVLDRVKNDRSAYIRKRLSMALGLPLPPDPQTVDLETLRAELTKAVDKILKSSPIAFSGTAAAPRARQDVNDKGNRIPDF